MKHFLPVLMVLSLVVWPLALPVPGASAATRTVDTPATPADSRPNSDAVPDAYALDGHFTRIVVMRMKHKADLLAGIQTLVRREHIRNGVILSGIGSLRGYHVHQVSNRTFPTQNIFTDEPDTPADLVGMNGYVVDGKVHAHMTLGTGAKAIAGHLEPGTEVFTYAIVTVGVLDTDLKGVDDKTRR
jgi:predicted DNA-binding protein with PD1-like motif